MVRVQKPWYAPRFLVRRKFQSVVPEYENTAGLEAKYFTISDESQYGGIYLWMTRAQAEQHFDAAWHEEVRRRRGVDANVLILNAWYGIEGGAMPRGAPAGARTLRYPAFATLVLWQLAPDRPVDQVVDRLAKASWPRRELIRAFVVTGPGVVGVAALWATRPAADQAVSISERGVLASLLGATGSEATAFEAPLLLDESLRGNDP